MEGDTGTGGEAETSIKTRRMFRTIYNADTVMTKVDGVDRNVVISDSFPIRCNVVQRDITSPLYLISALELILHKHDRYPNKGVNFGGKRVHFLGYADNAALIDYDVETTTARVTGSKFETDMII